LPLRNQREYGYAEKRDMGEGIEGEGRVSKKDLTEGPRVTKHGAGYELICSEIAR